MSVLRPKDPLLSGPKKTINFYGPVALEEALKRNAMLDGFESLSTYCVELMAFAIRAREAERVAQAAAEHAKK
jgi:hypothetical protein